MREFRESSRQGVVFSERYDALERQISKLSERLSVLSDNEKAELVLAQEIDVLLDRQTDIIETIISCHSGQELTYLKAKIFKQLADPHESDLLYRLASSICDDLLAESTAG
ncbi:MAG: hypothetical protein AAGC70_13790 [Pseudomonadota bacterium]